MLYGSGLRRDGATPNGSHVPGYVEVNLGVSHQFFKGDPKAFALRLDVINLFDEKYEIRDGTGSASARRNMAPGEASFWCLQGSLKEER